MLQSTIAILSLLSAALLAIVPTQAQEKAKQVTPLRVPHASKPPSLVCSSDQDWGRVPTTVLSKQSLTSANTDHESPHIAIFRISDPSQAATDLPADVTAKLDEYQAQYAFQWDKQNLYAYVQLREKNIDGRYTATSQDQLSGSVAGAALEDMLHSSVIVEVGAPSWQGWTTEMHVHVRAPGAAEPTSIRFGRTNAEEQFHKLEGQAIACPVPGGWVAKFTVAWLPYENWHPASGVTADLRLIAPLASKRKGYALATVIPFVLTD